MDIYDFLNSKDIREYLKGLKYKFSLPEAAFVIHHSRQATLDQKLSAIKGLIEEYPDCPMETHICIDAIESSHDFLKKYITVQEKQLNLFYRSDSDAVYSMNCHWPNGSNVRVGGLFQDAESCVTFFQEKSIYNRDETSSIFLTKHYLNTAESHGTVIQLELDSECEVMGALCERLLDEEENAVLTAFEFMWFAIPTPFRRGDILVYDCFGKKKKTPFVLDWLITWDAQELIDNGFPENSGEVKRAPQIIEMKKDDGDTSDMQGLGYFLDPNGHGLYRENIISYLDFEFYDGDLSGVGRLLQLVSYTLKQLPKHSVNIEFLINAAHRILKEHKEEMMEQKLPIICGVDKKSLSAYFGKEVE